MLEAYIFTVCSFLMSAQTVPVKPEQRATCAQVVTKAVASNSDPGLIASIAWHESRFIPSRVSSVGAVGPMQIIPKYWCPDGSVEKCDLIAAGIRAFYTYLDKSGLEGALCRYSTGKPCKRTKAGRAYARKVLATHDAMIDALYPTWHDRMVEEQCLRCPHCCTASLSE